MSLGLLCMSYGTARGPEDLEQYLTHIRRGREPSADLLSEMRGRYDAIGGRSPLIEITERQVRALEAALRDLDVRALRSNLIAAGTEPAIEDRPEPVTFSVACPALLFDELEIKRSEASKQKVGPCPF